MSLSMSSIMCLSTILAYELRAQMMLQHGIPAGLHGPWEWKGSTSGLDMDMPEYND